MAKKGMRRKVARRGLSLGRVVVGRAAGFVGTLRAELDQLHRERGNLDRQISALERALAEYGSASAAPRASAGAGRGSARRASGGKYRSGSLKEFIEQVLGGGGVMAVKDITEAVMKAGYPTKNKTLAKSVGIALAQMPTVSKQGRGKFKLA